MKRELTDEELAVVDKLIDALAGLSYGEAEFILKETLAGLKEVAIIKGTFGGRSDGYGGMDGKNKKELTRDTHCAKVIALNIHHARRGASQIHFRILIVSACFVKHCGGDLFMTDEERTLFESELCKLSAPARKIAVKLLADFDKLVEDNTNGVISLPGEEWRDVPGYEGLYKVSNRCRMKSLHHGVEKLHRPYPNVDGYMKIGLSRDGIKKSFIFHVIVAQVFVPNPDGKPEVNHKDGCKKNNRPENLEWVTRIENIRHAWKMGRYKGRPINKGNSRLTDDEVRYIREVYVCKHPEYGAEALAKKFKVHKSTIFNVVRHKTYTHVK